jgi:uncharacterized membrane protein
MDAPQLDDLGKAFARVATRRAILGALTGAFAVGRALQSPSKAFATTRSSSVAPQSQPAARESARYALTDLGTGTGNAGRAWLINSDGTIAGDQALITNGAVDPASVRLILWRGETSIDLTALGITEIQWFDQAGDLIARRGTDLVRYNVRDGSVEPAPDALPIIDPPAGFVSVGLAARNARGEIVGTVFPHADDVSGARGFVLTEQGMTLLDPVAAGDSSVTGDLNNDGIVVGGPAEGQSGPLPGLGFRYDLVAGTTIDLQPLPDYTGAAASGINVQGDIVGASHHPTNSSLSPMIACIWPADTLEPIALETLLLPETEWRCRAAYDINDTGEMVGSGWEGDDSNVRPFVLQPIP